MIYKILLLLPLVLLFGCVQPSVKLQDETLNRIAECTGGATSSQNFEAKIEADVNKQKLEIGANAEINYSRSIKGAIFSDETLTDDMKKFYFTKYQECLDKVRGTVTYKSGIGEPCPNKISQQNISVSDGGCTACSRACQQAGGTSKVNSCTETVVSRFPNYKKSCNLQCEFTQKGTCRDKAFGIDKGV